ncbi:MAG: NAD(P)-binding domain-containing protein [Chitinophagales bacterium]|nr:NAD(P)-binding domain-containing protein [Bacteroidota bacterium]MCB9044308.1 NAD(P)-binding domain-containing protein [Chitinophagales bacterium]
MIIAILGTGIVGQTLAENFSAQGHQVIIGTRSTQNKTAADNFAEWLNKQKNITLQTFDEAVKEGQIIVNALNGNHTISVLQNCNPQNFDHKILIDLSNPLDFSNGFPPKLIDGLNNEFSLGEAIQKQLPNAKVVKTLNTMWCGIMLNPQRVNNRQHINFICGNDLQAKQEVVTLLKNFGWTDQTILDLGDISNARGTEGYLLLWTRIYAATQNGAFNVQIVT